MHAGVLDLVLVGLTRRELEMAGIDEVQLRAEDDYAFEGDIADDGEGILLFLMCVE